MQKYQLFQTYGEKKIHISAIDILKVKIQIFD